MKTYADNSVLEGLQANFSQNVRGFVISMTGALCGILAFLLSAAGGITAAHALSIVFGVIFAPVALVGGGIGAAVFYRRATSEARSELEKSIKTLEDTYRQSLIDLTNRERNRLLQYGKQILAPVFSQLHVLADRYRDQQSLFDTFTDRAKGIEKDLAAIPSGQPQLVK
jgi:hypothetical protein